MQFVVQPFPRSCTSPAAVTRADAGTPRLVLDLFIEPDNMTDGCKQNNLMLCPSISL